MREPTIHLPADGEPGSALVGAGRPLCRPAIVANVISDPSVATCGNCRRSVRRRRRFGYVIAQCRRCGGFYLKRGPDSVCPSCYR